MLARSCLEQSQLFEELVHRNDRVRDPGLGNSSRKWLAMPREAEDRVRRLTGADYQQRPATPVRCQPRRQLVRKDFWIDDVGGLFAFEAGE